MPKGSFLDDTFEKAIEAGQSMVKAGSKQIKQTFDPRKMVENSLGLGTQNSQVEKGLKEAQSKNPNMTPLDFSKLQEKYADQDKSKTDALRNRFFQMVKSGEEKSLQDNKQKDAEKKRQELFLVQEKQRKDRERQQTQGQVNPQGKERKSIMGGKKKKGIQPSPTELKPSTGKQ